MYLGIKVQSVFGAIKKPVANAFAQMHWDSKRDVWALKRTCGSSRGPKFNYHNTHGGFQPSATLVTVDLISSLASVAQVLHRCTHGQTIPSQTKIIKKERGKARFKKSLTFVILYLALFKIDEFQKFI